MIACCVLAKAVSVEMKKIEKKVESQCKLFLIFFISALSSVKRFGVTLEKKSKVNVNFLIFLAYM